NHHPPTPPCGKPPGRSPAPRNPPDHGVSYVIGAGPWKCLTNDDGSHAELYHLPKDPLEKNDVHSSNPEAAKDLTQKLEAWKKSLPDKPSGKVFSSLREE
ncbi:MAG: hypothetical protein ACON38_13150, partial [Akkermansiaceae bacterium]